MEFTTVLSIAAGLIGVIWFFWTGAIWQFLPIASAIAIFQLAGKALREDDKPTPKKGTKK